MKKLLETSAPKPKPRPKKAAKPLVRSRPRSSNPARRKREWVRAYGSKARCSWMRDQPCIVCLPKLTRSESAHIESGGKGRKANADKVVPMCRDHHRELHVIGRASFEAKHSIRLDVFAAATEREWKAVTR